MTFIWGLSAGITIGIIATVVFALYMSKKHPTARVSANNDKQKLLMAKRRFGQISTRESIRHVRVIAHKAIKELS